MVWTVSTKEALAVGRADGANVTPPFICMYTTLPTSTPTWQAQREAATRNTTADRDQNAPVQKLLSTSNIDSKPKLCRLEKRPPHKQPLSSGAERKPALHLQLLRELPFWEAARAAAVAAVAETKSD